MYESPRADVLTFSACDGRTRAFVTFVANDTSSRRMVVRQRFAAGCGNIVDASRSEGLPEPGAPRTTPPFGRRPTDALHVHGYLPCADPAAARPRRGDSQFA